MSDSRFNDNNVFARGCHDVCCIETSAFMIAAGIETATKILLLASVIMEMK